MIIKKQLLEELICHLDIIDDRLDKLEKRLKEIEKCVKPKKTSSPATKAKG